MTGLILYTTEDGELVREATTEESSVVQTAEVDRQDNADLKAIETKLKRRPQK